MPAQGPASRSRLRPSTLAIYLVERRRSRVASIGLTLFLISLVVEIGGFCPPRAVQQRSRLSCPRRTPARSCSPWTPAHGRPAGRWVTPRPSNRALSRHPYRGARSAPSPQLFPAEGSVPP